MLTQIEYRIFALPNLYSFTMVLESFWVLFGVWNPVAKMYAPLMNWLKISHDYFMLGQVVGIYKKNYIFLW